MTRQMRSEADVLVCRLVGGKITYVHRRLWPALARLAPTLGARRLASIWEVHTKTGTHRVYRKPFGSWLPVGVPARAAKLTSAVARAQLGAAIVDPKRTPPRRAS